MIDKRTLETEFEEESVRRKIMVSEYMGIFALSCEHLPLGLVRSWISEVNSEFDVRNVDGTYSKRNLKAETERARDIVKNNPETYKKDKEYEAIKKSLPNIVATALMKTDVGRSMSAIESYTNIVATDIDHTGAQTAQFMAKLRESEYPLLALPSLSGDGIHILTRVTGVKIDSAETHKKAFEQVNNYYESLLGCKCDANISNPSTCIVLNYESDPVYNENAEALYVDVSQYKNNKSACLKIYEQVNNHIPFVDGSRNEHVSRAAYKFNRCGIPMETVIDTMRPYYSSYGDWEKVIRNVYKNHKDQSGTDRLVSATEKAKMKPGKKQSLTEAKEYLSSHYEIRRNLRMCNYDYRVIGEEEWKEFSEKKFDTVYTDMVESGINISDKVFRMIISSEFVPDYDCYLEYFESLPEWDGKDRLSLLWDRMPTEETKEYRNRYMTKFFVGVIRHMLGMSPNEVIPIITGRQGVGKTKFVKTIFGPLAEKFLYNKGSNCGFDYKDERIKICQYAVLLLDDGNNISMREYDALKTISSAETDSIRMPYGLKPEIYKTTASIIITTNNPNPLKDYENRRFPVLHVNGKIDTALINPISDEDYKQIYAQGYAMAKDKDFVYYVTEKDMEELSVNNEKYREMSVEEELVRRYCRKPDEKSDPKNLALMSVTQIYEGIKDVLQYKTPSDIKIRNITKVMTDMGFETKTEHNLKCYYIDCKEMKFLENSDGKESA